MKKFLVAVLLGIGADLASADEKAPYGRHPCVAKICRALPVIGKVERHCWEIECKEICIPRIQFPWSKCCGPRCGRVRLVRVLVKKEYEAKECGYKWEIESVPVECCEPCDPEGRVRQIFGVWGHPTPSRPG